MKNPLNDLQETNENDKLPSWAQDQYDGLDEIQELYGEGEDYSEPEVIYVPKHIYLY